MTHLLLAVVVSVSACQAPSKSQQKAKSSLNRLEDRERARLANKKGLAAVEDRDFELAEAHFRDALALDSTYAAPHNNLGLLMLRRGVVNAAAIESSIAAECAPDAVEPRTNLRQLRQLIRYSFVDRPSETMPYPEVTRASMADRPRNSSTSNAIENKMNSD